jgi:glycosyltransferase involved in cell wall biosynthesis
LYPYQGNPIYGIFVKEQIESLNQLGLPTEVVFINAKADGKLAYFTCVNKIKRLAPAFDLIHCHHSYAAYVALVAAKVKKPVVTSFLNVLGGEGRFGFIEKIIYKSVVSRSTAIIVKSDPNIQEKLPGKGHYLPNGVNLEFFKPESIESSCEKLNIQPHKYILFVSGGDKYRKQKRYDIFKAVLEILNTKYNAGVKELCLVDAPRNLVPHYFNASVLHLLPSDFEGSPNSVKEALACNKPVVTTDVGNVASMIRDISGCYVSPSNDPQVLAELVIKSLERENGVEGRDALIAQGLDMASVGKKVESIYSTILESKQQICAE